MTNRLREPTNPAPSARPREIADPTSRDAFLGGRFQLRQWRRGYRAGLDAMLLAATVNPPRCDDATPFHVADLGCGTGAVALAVAVRCARATVIGVERDGPTAMLARRNAHENGLDDRVTIVEADVRTIIAAPMPPDAREFLAPNRFDHVLINPPFHDPTRSRPSPDASKAAAHAMPDTDLELWLKRAAGLLKPHGCVTVVHRADATGALLAALQGHHGGRFGGLRLRFLHPRAAAPANRVLLRGQRGNRAPLTVSAPLVLHDEDGAFRDPVAACLDHRAASLTI